MSYENSTRGDPSFEKPIDTSHSITVSPLALCTAAHAWRRRAGPPRLLGGKRAAACSEARAPKRSINGEFGRGARTAHACDGGSHD
eukprot:scaffold3930_cov116-Isochrysis_galbana.AAC.3